jgi:hypothetical protein
MANNTFPRRQKVAISPQQPAGTSPCVPHWNLSFQQLPD